MFESGLEFLRADFHLHTQKDKEFSYSGEPNDFVKSYISALKQANISVGVITNHNKFDKDEYKALKRAASKEKIFILSLVLDFCIPKTRFLNGASPESDSKRPPPHSLNKPLP